VNRMSLRGRFFLISLPLTALVVAFVIVASYYLFRRQAEAETTVRASILARAMADSNNVRLALFSRDEQLARTEVERFSKIDPEIDYLILLDDSGRPLAFQAGNSTLIEAGKSASDVASRHSTLSDQTWQVVVHRAEAITAEETPDVAPESEWLGSPGDKGKKKQLRTVGQVLVSVNGTAVFIRTFTPLAVAGVALPVIFFLAISLLFTQLFGRITHMVDFASTVATGDLAQQLHIVDNDEIGALAAALNRMAQNLSRVLARVAKVAAELGLITARITESANGLSRGSQRQWASLEQTRAELDVMSSSLNETARNVEAISQWAHQSADDAKAIGDRNTAVRTDVDRLAGAIESMTSSVEQVAHNITAMAQHVEVLSQAAGETESAITRTESAVQSVRRLADNSSALVERVAVEAQGGAGALTGAIGAITRLEGVMADVRAATSTLTERLNLVAALLQAIVDVARRTNLLSLNAAIIASQAGEHGRQFHVVADEVKALAGQTAGLTRDIEQVLKEVGRASLAANNTVAGASETVAEGASQAQQVGNVLDRIVDAASQASRLSHEIATAMAERETDLQRVNRAMERVVAVTNDIRSVTNTQVRAAELMRESSRTISAVGEAVGQSSQQQLAGSARISRALGDVSDSVTKLSRTQALQAQGGERILGAVEEVRQVADKNRAEARAVEQSLEVLSTQTSELRSELDRFVLDPNALGSDTAVPWPVGRKRNDNADYDISPTLPPTSV